MNKELMNIELTNKEPINHPLIKNFEQCTFYSLAIITWYLQTEFTLTADVSNISCLLLAHDTFRHSARRDSSHVHHEWTA